MCATPGTTATRANLRGFAYELNNDIQLTSLQIEHALTLLYISTQLRLVPRTAQNPASRFWDITYAEPVPTLGPHLTPEIYLTRQIALCIFSTAAKTHLLAGGTRYASRQTLSGNSMSVPHNSVCLLACPDSCGILERAVTTLLSSW